MNSTNNNAEGIVFAIKKVVSDDVLMRRKVWFMLVNRQVLEFQIVPAID